MEAEVSGMQSAKGGEHVRTGHPRLLMHNFLSPDQCKELEFIHRSSSAVGYRPSVFSTTLSHLIATNSAHLIIPFLPIRESLKEKVEEYFGCEFQLFVEFTGLISWTRGSSIGWHRDDNRTYLKQREFAAVCYLGSHGKDFMGGLFHFQDGPHQTIVPQAGDVVLYTADSRNIHCVDEVTEGERLALTMWFTRNASYDEDVKLISFLAQRFIWCDNDDPHTYLPFPASTNMYQFSNYAGNNMGFDIRYARLQSLGYDIYSSQGNTFISESDSVDDLLGLLAGRLQLVRRNELFSMEFGNVMHALQVVEFYRWKALEVKASCGGKLVDAVELSECDMQKVSILKQCLSKDSEPSGVVEFEFGGWGCLHAAVTAWEAYTFQLRKKTAVSLPQWIAHRSLFVIP